MTDIDERQNRIVVGTNASHLIGKLRGDLLAAGVPADAMEVVEIGDPISETSSSISSSVSTAGFLSENLNSWLRPAPGGAEIRILFPSGQTKACTLGFNLFPWINGSPGAERYFITASHCFALSEPNIGLGDGTDVGQLLTSQRIGFKAADTWWPYSGGNPLVPDCTTPTTRKCRFADAALVRYELPASSRHGQVAFPPNASKVFDYTVSITGLGEVYQGQTVHMIGQRSGRRTGSVSSVCANFPQGTTWTKMCQIRASYYSQDGDSGAPIVALTGTNTALAIGIHWGRSGSYAYFFPLYYALDEWYDYSSPYRSLGYMDPGPLP